MPTEPTFAEFLRRVRAGDTAAAAELVRRYEPVVRVEVRLRLTDPALRRVVDTTDVCQSVLASFFIRAAVGAYDLDSPQQLGALLTAMARNKVAFLVRKQRARKRGGVVEADPDRVAASQDGPEPFRFAQGRELLDEVRRRLSDEERALADRRAEGRGWADIAAELGTSAEAARKQLRRALDRVAGELGLDEV